MNRALSCFVAGVVSSSLLGCASGAMLPQAATVGPQPTIPKPAESLIPVMRTPKAVGWPAGGAPVAPAGFAVSRFAEGLDHPRWIQVLANGDVLVALSSTEPTKVRSIKDMVMQSIMKRVGALQESPNQIILLRDANADGVAETRSVLLSQGLNQPFGMAVLRGHLYVGNTDSLVRFPFQPGQTQITAAPEKVVDLPHAEGGHWTRNVIPSRDGSRLFVTVGSLSNIGDEGMAVEENRAAIWEIDPASKSYKVYARGLRNPNGLAWEPSTGTLFTVVNERDLIGDDASPDYLTSVRQGAHYGWPWAYWGRVDDRVKPPNPAVANSAVKPD